MKIVITGVGGFVGAHLAAVYRDAGHDVIGVDNYAWGIPGRAGSGVEELEIDITTGRLPILRGVDLVVHSAAFASERLSHSKPDLCRRVNVIGTSRVTDWAMAMGAKLIHLSTGAIDSKPPSPYSISKELAEEVVRVKDPNAAIIRLWCLYGPGQVNHQEHRSVFAIWADAVQHGRPIKVRGGNQTRQFTYLPDIELPRRILQAEPGSFAALGSANPVSVMKCANLFSQITGGDVLVEDPDPNDSQSMGMPPTIPYAGGETPIEKGLALYWQWWQSEERSQLGVISGKLGYVENTPQAPPAAELPSPVDAV